MTAREAEKLLGGYATGTLTEAERQSLMRAAIEDQELFDALADEEALRDLLTDPAARRRLAAGLAREHGSWWSWLWRPVPMAGLVTAMVAVLAFVGIRTVQKDAAQTVAVATRQEPLATPTQAPITAPVPDPVPIPGPRPATSGIVPPLQRAKEQSVSSAAPSRELRDERRSDIATAPPEEAKKSEEAAKPKLAAAPPPPPQVAAEPPASPAQPKPVIVGEVAAQNQARLQVAAEEKVAVAQAPAAAPEPRARKASVMRGGPPPFRYQVERRQADGQWVQFGGELTAGDEVRIRVEPEVSGLLTLQVPGGPQLVTEAIAGQVAYLPQTGALPSEAGEKRLVLSYTRTLVPTETARLETRFQPGGFIGGRQAVGKKRASTKSEKAATVQADRAADAVAVRPPVEEQDASSVVVTLRYR